MNVTTIRVFRIGCILLLAWSLALGISAQNADRDITAHYKRMMVYHRYMEGSVPDGAVLFIGDSITQGLCVVAVCDKAALALLSVLRGRRLGGTAAGKLVYAD